jgi:hypothetical protein
MAIKSLTREASFPEIGQLRKGGEKETIVKNGKEIQTYGKDLNHFRFTSPDPSAVAKFEQVFGKEPQALNIFLPFPSVEQNFDYWQEAYTAGALQHRCDGETCVVWLTPQGKYSTEPKPCPGGCKASGRLKLFIPAFERLAFVTALTNSKHDIINLSSSLQALVAVRGNLQGIPMVLRRVEKEISTPSSDGKRARRKKWLLQIEAEPQWAALQFGAMREAALLTASHQPLMLESHLDDEDELPQIGELIERLRAVADTAGYGTEKRMAAWLKDNIEALPARGNLAFKSWLESFSAELLQYVIDELVAEVERNDIPNPDFPSRDDNGRTPLDDDF